MDVDVGRLSEENVRILLVLHPHGVVFDKVVGGHSAMWHRDVLVVEASSRRRPGPWGCKSRPVYHLT